MTVDAISNNVELRQKQMKINRLLWKLLSWATTFNVLRWFAKMIWVDDKNSLHTWHPIYVGCSSSMAEKNIFGDGTLDPSRTEKTTSKCYRWWWCWSWKLRLAVGEDIGPGINLTASLNWRHVNLFRKPIGPPFHIPLYKLVVAWSLLSESLYLLIPSHEAMQ